MGRTRAALLTPQEAKSLDARVKGFEMRTGVEVLCVVTPKSDAYPELPWKAFALGVAVAALLIVLRDAFDPEWPMAHAVLVPMALALATGAACAVSVVLVPAVARLFLHAPTADVEVRTQAKALAVDRGLAGTPRRRALLVLASAFERRMAGVADIGIAHVVTETAWRDAFHAARAYLARGDMAAALHAALDVLEPLVTSSRMQDGEARVNRLADAPLEERAR